MKSQLFGANSGTTKALVNAQVYLPSFMFKVKHFTFAFTSRARVMANIADLNGKLADKVSSDFSDDPELPYTITSNDKMRVSMNGWVEYNLSTAREIIHLGPHYVKGGVTIKYMTGVGNGSLQIDNLHGTLIEDEGAQDVALTNATGKIGTNFAGISFTDFEAGDLTRFVGHGVGFELGAVYEYRPGDSKDYKLRVGVSLSDIGRIKYERDVQRSGTFNINIPANQNFYLSSLDGVSIDDYKTALNKYPQYFTPDGNNESTTYSVSLPGRLQLDADYHIKQHFFVNANGQFSLATLKKKAFNSQYFGGLTVTPRYDGRIFGFFLPLSYNTLTKFNAGASFRVGPLFLGSGSVLTALAGGAHQADFFIGVRFGGLQRK
ncbi:DUF5723 family protein [Chitinophaga jiangningensis]|uniref:DUF5723 family protein n=1 Tax=Chitinophaga jiangningensis TaxID=1419482 RepID=UPI0029371240|nr:DUF5723 family protein [Chitinophaga jiangningensis]